MRLSLLALSLVATVAAGCGGDIEDACDTVCGKSAECEGTDRASCTKLCEDLSEKDEDYATGIEARASCYEDYDLACNELTTCDYITDN